MVVNRGEIWWADLPEPFGSSPGFRRPVLIIQADVFNRSNLNTAIVVLLTTNLVLGEMSGNVFLKKSETHLPKDSVVNATQLFTLDKRLLNDFVGTISGRKLEQVEEGLRLVLSI